MITRADLERDLVIVACAVSAGVHGALTPAHFEEGTGAGAGFLAATLVLAGLAVVLTRRPASGAGLAGAAVVFAGLIGSYALATTTGVPLLHPEPDPVGGIALFTKSVEVVGLVAAAHLLHPASLLHFPRPKGMLT